MSLVIHQDLYVNKSVSFSFMVILSGAQQWTVIKKRFSKLLFHCCFSEVQASEIFEGFVTIQMDFVNKYCSYYLENAFHIFTLRTMYNCQLACLLGAILFCLKESCGSHRINGSLIGD